MAIIYWIGKADAVAQQVTAIPGAPGTPENETFTLSIGGASVSYTAEPGDTAADVAAALAERWNAATHPYITAITAAAEDAVLTLTADIAGVPFTISADATGDATLTLDTVTASAGPNDWSTPGNWSTGELPGDDDVVVIEHNDVPILWGLGQSAITLAELRIMASYTGRIGLPEQMLTTSVTTVDASKSEYRPTCLAIGAAVARIGEHFGVGNPAGAARIKLDTGSAVTQLNIFSSAAIAADGALEPIRWKGSHADNVVNVSKGRLGVATGAADETTVISELNIGQRGNRAADAHVTVGAGVSVATINQMGGELITSAGATSIEQSGGTLTSAGSAAFGNAVIGGIAHLNATGTITDLRIRGSGQANFSRDPRPRTVTNCRLHKGATLNLANGRPLSVTLTTGIDFIDCEPADTTLVTGPHVKLTLAAPV